MSLLQVGYWNIRGLAAPLRMMLCYCNVQFENKAYCLNEEFDRSLWLTDAKPAFKAKNALANLPYIQDGDVLVCQSNACFSYLGRKLGLWGTCDGDVLKCEQLLCEVMDLRNNVVGFSYGRTGNPADVEEARAFISRQAGILSKLELWLSMEVKFSAESPFFVSGYATAPDFHIFEMLDQIQLLAQCRSLPSVIGGDAFLPNLEVFYHNFRKLPGNDKYFASKMASAPCNNLMAVFGSMPEGQQWQTGMTLPEDTSGVY